MDTYDGGCHCGAIRFRVTVDAHQAVECTCSMCRKKAILHLIVRRDRFTLLSGAEVLSAYGFNTGTATHLFCRRCGIHPFYVPRSHPDQIDVNVRCLDGDVAQRFQIVPFDGANWEVHVHRMRG